MEILTSKVALASTLSNLKQGNGTIGFVPTMGALHAGHLSLIRIAKELTDIIVCSIFVNPTQFNNLTDLEKYPRPIEADITLLKDSGCHVLFMPDVDEMYSDNEVWNFDIGYLEGILEGKYRAGHYQGVTQIVKKLLNAVKPDYMFLGQKDFQQVMVLDHMVKKLGMTVELVMCPIVRESDGLALSSRNIHLSKTERSQALILSKTLFAAKDNFNSQSVEQLKLTAWDALDSAPGVTPEYFELCDSNTLLPIQSKDEKGIVALVAARVGNTRLIDNIILK
ncbi:MAG: pantoate--beta-alanine ligase [Pyrinomonadaceae bacterium]|nr:pantoate--beta-alanine ligase [Sphingobacteriaceae bacterium]